jgi:RND family efflux transporter MFP subunit
MTSASWSCTHMKIGALIGTWALCAAAVAAPPPQDFDCLIEPAQVVELRSPFVGLLQRVHVHRGDLVRQGQVLASIESSVEHSAAEAARLRASAQGAVQQAGHRAAAAAAKARRMAELQLQDFVSAQARDDAAAEARIAQAELTAATENAELARQEHRLSLDQLNRRVLRSPFNGVVVDQYLHAGALVDPGDSKKPILKIAQTQPLVVQAILPFRYFVQVKTGAAAVVVPEAPFTQDVTARITAVDRVVDSAAGTFGVLLHLPNANQALPGGIRCKLRIQGL